MKYNAKGFALTLFIVALNATAQSPRSVDDVLDDYVKAAGGLTAIDAINTRKIRASDGLLGKQEIYWEKPNKVLLLANSEKTGYDGGAGWVYSKKKKIRRLSKGEQLPIEINANPLRYVHLHQLYSEIDAAPQQTVDGTLMDVLVAPNDLAQTKFYFNAQTHLLARVEEKGEESAYFTHTIWFEDYRTVDGIQFPHRITHKSDDKTEGSVELRIKSIEDNVDLDARIFSKPQASATISGGKR